MSLRDHLRELRNRIVLAAAGILIGAVGGWFLFEPTFTELQRPLVEAAARDDALVAVNFSGLASALDIRIKVSVFLGLIVSSPWWLYQLWAFIAPGLTRRERKATVGFIASAVPMFLVGVGVAWLVFPHAVAILTDFRPEDSEQLLDAEMYLVFAMRLLIAFGLAFVFPVIMVSLSWLGIVSPRAWLRSWRWAIVGIFVFAGAMTPTPDAVSMIVMALPMVALYFGAIGIGALGHRKRAKERV